MAQSYQFLPCIQIVRPDAALSLSLPAIIDIHEEKESQGVFNRPLAKVMD
jgi:hypothetical protein